MNRKHRMRVEDWVFGAVVVGALFAGLGMDVVRFGEAYPGFSAAHAEAQRRAAQQPAVPSPALSTEPKKTARASG